MFTVTETMAQSTLDIGDGESRKLFKHEMTGGFTAHSRGWGLNLRYGQILADRYTRIFDVEFTTMRSPKEKKLQSLTGNGGKKVKYGKLNTFNILRLNLGADRTIYAKEFVKGVKISYTYQYGLALGFEVPVYLKIRDGDNTTEVVRYDPDEHYLDVITNGAPFYHGLSDMKLKPGISLKGGMIFEYSQLDEGLKAMEVGVAADIFPQGVQIMANNPIEYYMLTIYANIMLGKKWY